jgi:hypothetical protein
VRQGQQNRRGRGRNRKSQNPLSRSFESNGPDVKIRGTPAHIAEKYLTLARDAQSSGDHVLAENYLQHAEHYSRIIMAYREQLQQNGEAPNGNGQRLRGPNDPGEGDDFGDDDGGDDMMDDGFPQPALPQHQGGQGHHQGGGGNRHQGYDANRDRPYRREQNRFRDRDRYNDRNDRGGGDRNDRPSSESRPPVPQDRPADAPAEAGGGEQRRRDRFQQPHEQPEFLRRPVRRARSEGSEPATPAKEEPRE